MNLEQYEEAVKLQSRISKLEDSLNSSRKSDIKDFAVANSGWGRMLLSLEDKLFVKKICEARLESEINKLKRKFNRL
ncbi:hypothetical protein [Flavobacterium alkalisoli]|uniref:hypothetical protein n=1 Tax=Flavobacterium alkalisoli TaxID=2602769 RepID=UPI003A8D3861